MANKWQCSICGTHDVSKWASGSICVDCQAHDWHMVIANARLGAAVRKALAEYETGPVTVTGLKYWAKGLRNDRKPLAAHILEAIAQALEKEGEDDKE